MFILYDAMPSPSVRRAMSAGDKIGFTPPGSLLHNLT